MTRSVSPPLKRKKADIKRLRDAVRQAAEDKIKYELRKGDKSDIDIDESRRLTVQKIGELAREEVLLRTNLAVEKFQQQHERRPSANELAQLEKKAEEFVGNDLLTRNKYWLHVESRGNTRISKTKTAKAPPRLVNDPLGFLAARAEDQREEQELLQEPPPPRPTDAAQLMREFLGNES